MLRNKLLAIKNSKLARNAAWMFSGQGLSTVAQAFYFVAIARLLGSKQYGVLVGASAAVGLVSQFSSMGSGFVFLRYVTQDRKRSPELLGRVLAITLTLGAGLVFVLWTLRKWLLPTCPAVVLIAVALGDCICSQMAMSCSLVFQAYEKMKITAMLGLLVNVMRAMLAVTLLVTLKHSSAVVWAGSSLAISFFASLVAVIIVIREFGQPIFRLESIKSYWGEGFVFAVSSSTTSIYNDIDKAMLGHLGMNSANGIYSTAYRVIDIGFMPIRAIHAAAFPRFFKHGTEGLEATRVYARKILSKTTLIGFAMAFAMMFAAPIIPKIVGHGFSQSVTALRWLCFIPLMRCFHLSAGDALTGAGYQSFRLAGQAFAATLNFSLNLYLIPHYSWVGAAWASVATDGALGIINWITLAILIRRQKGRSNLRLAR